MQRPYHLAVAVLAALTAVALLGAAVAIRPPGLSAEPDGPHEAANRALAHAFYAAANAAIETGDLVPLAIVVAPDLLAEEATEDGRAGPVGLRRRLLAIHAAMPTLRLTVTELAVDGDLVIARLDAGATRMESFLGLPLVESAPAWGPADVLRLADGRVVELPSSTDGTVLLEPALTVPRGLDADDPHVLAVERITIAAEATHGAAAVAGFRLLYLEACALIVEFVATSFYAAQSVQLAAGDGALVVAGSAAMVGNGADVPVTLLIVTLLPADAPAPTASPPTPAASPHPLIGL